MYNILFKVGKKLEKLLPKSIFNFLWFLFDNIYFIPSWNKKLVKKNKCLKWTWKWKRAFLLATWPSIKKDNLKKLKWEDCFSISNFFLHDDINIICPKFHFFAPYHKPLILENYIERLKQADKVLPKETKIFLGHTTRQYVDKYKLFPWRDIYYLYLSPFASKNNYNIEKQILAPQTWPQMILPVLFYMWYKEIYLLWCDHNTLKTYWEDRKDFYDRWKDIRKNAADKNLWKQRNIVDELESNLRMFNQYKIYKNTSQKQWIKIFNLSEESWLDEFEKKELNEIL